MNKLSRLAIGVAAAASISVPVAGLVAADNDGTNTVAYWCPGGLGFKYEPVSDPFIVPEPPAGYTWTLLVLKASSGPDENATFPNPVVGQGYSHPSEHANSHAILCKQPITTTTTTEATTSTTAPTTTSLPGTTTEAPTTTIPASTTTTSTAITTTTEPASTTQPGSSTTVASTTVPPTTAPNPTTSSTAPSSTSTVPPTSSTLPSSSTTVPTDEPEEPTVRRPNVLPATR